MFEISEGLRVLLLSPTGFSQFNIALEEAGLNLRLTRTAPLTVVEDRAALLPSEPYVQDFD